MRRGLNPFQLLLTIFLGFLLVFSPILTSYAQTTETSDIPADSEAEYEEGESYDPEIYTQEYLDSVSGKELLQPSMDFLTFYNQSDVIELSPQDVNAIRDNRVDVRVINYLTYLASPKELGGAGLSRIKAQRILKNYDTDGRGKYDRESLDAIEEDVGIVSAHHSGQAVDISEVGKITCKLVERRHLGGNKTRFQRAKPIKVAWQSRDGIARNPTPRGPSLTEIAGTLGTDGIMQMLNESGEMDFLAEFGKGLRLEDVLLYVGANILLKEFGGGSITSDPLADPLIRSIGASYLHKIIPGLPEGFSIADNDQDTRIAIARANIEMLLGVPPGTLRGSGWQQILESAGKRTIENAAGLPTLFLDTHSLEDMNKIETVRGVFSALEKKDAAFGVITGTIDKIQRNDTEGLIWAGVNVLADAFRLTDQQRQALESATRARTTPPITLENAPIDRSVPIASLAKLFAEDKARQQAALTELRDYGYNFLREAAVKGIPGQYRAIGNGVVRDLLAGKEITLGYLKDNIAASVIAEQTGLDFSSARDLTRGKFNSKSIGVLTNFINKELELDPQNQLSAQDVQAVVRGDGLSVLQKVGGAQADNIIGWNIGTGYQVIKGEKKLEIALQEVFGNSITSLLGLDRGTTIPLTGDLQGNYGQAIVEQRLGLPTGYLKDRPSAGSFSGNDLERYFGSDYEEWEYTDLILGVPIGTTEQFVNGAIDTKSLIKKAGGENLINIGVDQIWNYFDLDETLRIKTQEAQFLLDTIRNWENAPLEDRAKALNFSVTLVGRFLDRQANFTRDTFLAFALGDTQTGTKLLIAEGIKQLAGALGLKLDGFDEDALKTLANQITRAFSGDLNDFEKRSLITKLAKATGIPIEYVNDIENFIDGDYRQALEHWSSAMWSEFANKYLPEEGKLSYEELRSALNFADSDAINAAAVALFNEQTGSNMEVNEFMQLSESTRKLYQDSARKELTQTARDNTKYKISDAFLRQAGILVPVDFSRVMFSGSDKERAAMLTSAVFAYLDPELAALVPGYQIGMLEKLYKGELTSREADGIVGAFISRLDIGLGPFTSDFVKTFYQFVRNSNRDNFFTASEYQGMWNYLDSWFSNTLGIQELPSGFVKSIYYASQNGFDFNKGLVIDGRVVVPSLTDLGRDFVIGKVTQWADKALGLPAGSVYQLYQAVNGIITASRALTAAHAAAQGINVTVQALTGLTGTGDALVNSARTSLAKAQANLTVLAITIALNACEACQAFFASIDQAIQAPPGFTNAAVAGAIAMAAGLGPAGLIIAAGIYLFGTYRVDYLCPIPPPDRFANAQFDPDYDKLEYNYGDYYNDPNKPIKDTPAEGENPFDWDDGVPFKDGNDPKLWMAWSRYFTGKLLEATMDYGASQQGANKPVQVITFRQANAEYFYPRSLEVFGPGEANNPRVGLGFTQRSTKTTDWVHTAFGGFF
jgi:hypothetical protein